MFACVYTCAPGTCLVSAEARRGVIAKELKLQMIVSHHVEAMNRTLVL